MLRKYTKLQEALSPGPGVKPHIIGPLVGLLLHRGHTALLRFLVLCHFHNPGVFTVKAGFNLPGGQVAGVGSLTPVEEERASRGLSAGDQRLVIITADSLEEARMARMAARPGMSASMRQARTISHHLLGTSDLGEKGGTSAGFMLILLVAAVIGTFVIILGTFVICRSARSTTASLMEESCEAVDEEEEAEGRGKKDREQLQPKQRGGKRESRA